MTDTHFGRERVTADAKTARVRQVFDTVAPRYDVMNDLMSFGTHRLMKRVAVESTGLRPGQRALDLASGTADLARLLAPLLGTSGQLVLADININMLATGRDRMLDAGITEPSYVQTPAEALPFANDYFDCTTIAFGLRNFTDKAAALNEVLRVTRPGGVLVVLEFSQVRNPTLRAAYRAFQATWAPLGRLVVGDAAPYQYLVESIERHPNQEALGRLIEAAGFQDVTCQDLVGGAAAIHRGVKPSGDLR